MKNAKEVYPEYWEDEQERGSFYGPGDYQPMLDEFGKIVVQVDDDNYQGDSRVLYEQEGRIGYLNFGWGSCSGCDALQVCDNMAEIQELMDGLQNSIKWFDSKAEALQWFKEHDWEGEYTWHAEEQKQFLQKAMDWLEGA